MKSFAFVLLCVIAAVQARSAGVQVTSSQRSLAALGENPWVVHLRLARSTSGFLHTCAGSMIHESWVLTSAACADDTRFMWVRYGAVETIKPTLVLETSAVRIHQLWSHHENNIAVVAVNRAVETTQYIAPIALPAQGAEAGDSGNLCAYGENEDNTPGDYLSCYDVQILAVNNQALIGGDDLAASEFDTGAPLVADGVQIGIWAAAGESDGTVVFTYLSNYVDWIVSQTGIQLSREAPKPEAPEAIIIVDN